MNNFNVHDSTVGVINTGDVELINSSLKLIRSRGEQSAADAIGGLLNVVAASNLSEAMMTETVESLRFVAAQAAIDREERQKSIGRRCIKQIGDALAHLANAATVWGAAAPILSQLFS